MPHPDMRTSSTVMNYLYENMEEEEDTVLTSVKSISHGHAPKSALHMEQTNLGHCAADVQYDSEP